MTETNATFANEEVKKEVTVRWSKMTDGIGLVFAGVMSMLEALDAGTARDILQHVNQTEADKKEGEDDAAEETGAGTVDDAGVAGDAAVADPAGDVEAEKSAPKDELSPTVTQDDITKIIVQKLKKDRTNNEKIGAILKTYGVAKVSELPAEKYEAFLTDLSQL
ncbi:MAG: hypothetical protein J6I76_16300 [Oribacterium sp.]|nr:hypothetical protein [Lachnospiraceae bacterium]MBP3805419.1 hypothetical protein [Oribacterium sp.]